jgi:hypothetical protein
MKIEIAVLEKKMAELTALVQEKEKEYGALVSSRSQELFKITQECEAARETLNKAVEEFEKRRAAFEVEMKDRVAVVAKSERNAEENSQAVRERGFFIEAKEKGLQERLASAEVRLSEIGKKEAEISYRSDLVVSKEKELEARRQEVEKREASVKASEAALAVRTSAAVEAEAQAEARIQEAGEAGSIAAVKIEERRKFDEMLKKMEEIIESKRVFAAEAENRENRLKLREAVIGKREKALAERESTLRAAENAMFEGKVEK